MRVGIVIKTSLGDIVVQVRNRTSSYNIEYRMGVATDHA